MKGNLGDIGHESNEYPSGAARNWNWSEYHAGGVFLKVKPVVVDLGKYDPPGKAVDGDDTKEIDKLRAALYEAQEQHAARDMEIARLQEELEKEEIKLWGLNCTQLTVPYRQRIKK